MRSETLNKNLSRVILAFLCLITLSIFSARLYAQDNEIKSKLKSRLPVISVAPGIFNFIGDIGNNKANGPFLSKTGFQLELQHHTESRFSFAAILLSGQVFGEEQDRSRALNFKSSIVAQGIMFRYDFINRKRSDQVLIPYLTIGMEYVFFHSFADLKDSEGNLYHYWADGSIRNVAQSDTAAYRAVKLRRDYTYETDLRDANLDGIDKYNESSWAFPIGAGVRFVISPKISMHFSSVLHMVNSDMLDGLSEKGEGARKGNPKNDKFLYSSVSFRFDLAAERSTNSKNGFRPSMSELQGIDFNALANEDADNDGIPDIKDDSSATPASNEVDSKGRPLDKDNDGIPDYRDLELNSAVNAVVTVDGVTITEEMIEAKFQKDSLAALPALVEYIQSYDRLIQRNPGFEKEEIEKIKDANPNRSKIPSMYQRLDIDGNEYISPMEISKAIEEYMAGKSVYSMTEFYNLIDFFFLQR